MGVMHRNKTSTIINWLTLNTLSLGPLAINLYYIKIGQIKDTLSSTDAVRPYCIAIIVTPAL
jgi:hypothetical protein